MFQITDFGSPLVCNNQLYGIKTTDGFFSSAIDFKPWVDSIIGTWNAPFPGEDMSDLKEYGKQFYKWNVVISVVGHYSIRLSCISILIIFIFII